MVKKIEVLVADDHELIRSGIKHILEDTEDIEVSAEAADGILAVQVARKNTWDIGILDVNMPNRNGIETLVILKKEFPRRPILLLSMHPEEQYAVRAIENGASGYITKQSASLELVKAIRYVAGGGKYITPTVAERLAGAMGNKNKPTADRLSNRELQVLMLIAAGKPLTQVGDLLSLSVSTVSIYRRRILDKLELDNTGALIRFGIENGLVK
ncbi:MAG: response regulator transcription factor [Sterolibacterium sp.]|jgi:DNA-binding NarL/FixJ family response regulator